MSKNVYRGLFKVIAPHEKDNNQDVIKYGPATVRGVEQRVARVRGRLISRPYLNPPKGKDRGDCPIVTATFWPEQIAGLEATCEPGVLYDVEYGTLEANDKGSIFLSIFEVSVIPTTNLNNWKADEQPAPEDLNIDLTAQSTAGPLANF